LQFDQVLNHNTGDSTYCPDVHLAPLFAKKGMMWGATIGGTILGFIIFWPLGFVGMIAPYIYFSRRFKNAVKGMFASREYQALQAQLKQVKPAAAAAAA
jgi:hypothetical protein